MALVEKKIQVSKELSEMGDYIEALVVKFYEEKAKGTEGSTAMLNSLSGNIAQLLQSIDGIAKAKEEIKANLGASIFAIGLPVMRAIFLVVQKKSAEPKVESKADVKAIDSKAVQKEEEEAKPAAKAEAKAEHKGNEQKHR